MFLDIEDSERKSNPVPIDSIRSALSRVMKPISATFAHEFKSIVIWCSVLDRYRIYTNVSMKLNQMKFIIEKELGMFWRYIDTSPYHVRASLWMVNSVKYNPKTKSIEDRMYKVPEDVFRSCIIHNTIDTLILPESSALSYKEYY